MNKVVTFGTLVAEKWACEVPCIARPSLMDLFIWERGAFSEFSKNLKSLNTKGWALTQAWALPQQQQYRKLLMACRNTKMKQRKFHVGLYYWHLELGTLIPCVVLYNIVSLKPYSRCWDMIHNVIKINQYFRWARVFKLILYYLKETTKIYYAIFYRYHICSQIEAAP